MAALIPLLRVLLRQGSCSCRAEEAASWEADPEDEEEGERQVLLPMTQFGASLGPWRACEGFDPAILRRLVRDRGPGGGGSSALGRP